MAVPCHDHISWKLAFSLALALIVQVEKEADASFERELMKEGEN
jgi:hypothetical protein